jgi:hypothetical protein
VPRTRAHTYLTALMPALPAGTGFSTDYAAGHNVVWIGATSECVTTERAGHGACTVLCSNFNQIVCTTAPRAASSSALPITVTVDGQFAVPATAGVGFTYVAGRSGNLVGVFPSSGKAGTILNLRGHGWSSMQVREHEPAPSCIRNTLTAGAPARTTTTPA